MRTPAHPWGCRNTAQPSQGWAGLPGLAGLGWVNQDRNSSSMMGVGCCLLAAGWLDWLGGWLLGGPGRLARACWLAAGVGSGVHAEGPDVHADLSARLLCARGPCFFARLCTRISFLCTRIFFCARGSFICARGSFFVHADLFVVHADLLSKNLPVHADLPGSHGSPGQAPPPSTWTSRPAVPRRPAGPPAHEGDFQPQASLPSTDRASSSQQKPE